MRFYGSSFIADATGAPLVAEASDQDKEEVDHRDIRPRCSCSQLRDNWFVFLETAARNSMVPLPPSAVDRRSNECITTYLQCEL